MTRERWGTFSVVDHKLPQAFVADVLLYDRLIIPVPPEKPDEQTKWPEGWASDRLKSCLDILGDIAIRVPWDQEKRQVFKSHFAAAKDAAFDCKNLADPYYTTRKLLVDKFLPKRPDHVFKVWAMAAYPSIALYEQDISVAKEERRERLAFVLKHKFLVPAYSGKSDEELLKEATALARRDDFRTKRSAFYKWQENVIEEGIPDAEAIGEMEEYLRQYNDVVREAHKDVFWKYAFMVIPVAISVVTTGLGVPLMAAGAAGLISVASFARFDSKPRIEHGDFEAAAMLHDINMNLNCSP